MESHGGSTSTEKTVGWKHMPHSRRPFKAVARENRWKISVLSVHRRIEDITNCLRNGVFGRAGGLGRDMLHPAVYDLYNLGKSFENAMETSGVGDVFDFE